MSADGQTTGEQRLMSLVAAIADLVWECDLTTGAFAARQVSQRGRDWFPEGLPTTLNAARQHLEPWEWPALLRAWVRFAKRPGVTFETEFWLRGNKQSIRLRAAVTACDENGAPRILMGKLEAVGGGWDAEESVHESLRTAVESSPDVLLATDPQGRLVYRNQLAKALLQSGPGEVSPSRWWKALSGAVDDAEEFERNMAALLEDAEHSASFEFRLGDGRAFSCLRRRQALRRREIGWLWRFQDISKEYQAKAELRLAVERLELGLVGTGDGIFDWDMRTDQLYMTHLPEVPSSDTTRNWVHPDDRAAVAEAMRAHLEDGVPYDVEFRNQVPGRPLKWWRARGVAVRDSQGKPYRFVGCHTDITARRAAVEALAQRERDYRTVLSQIHEVVFEADADGTLRYLNPAWTNLLGHGVDECLGSPLTAYVAPEDRETVAEQLRSPILGYSGHAIECRWLTADGGKLWLELRPGRIGASEQEPRIFGTLADIEARRAAQTETERARRAAEEANQAKSEFLAAVSHELRTPLSVISGSNELLLETPLGEDARHHAQLIRSNARMLQRLIEDLLDISRIEAGQIEINRAPFDPVQLLESVCEQFRATAQAKGLTLDLILREPLPLRLLGDAHRIQQIAGNLTGNAVKFTQHGGVRIVAETLPEGLRLSVEDTGPGVPAEARERIFEKFVQVRAAQGGRWSGIGLGLTISRSLAETMGGRLYLESSGHKGSTFSVELPLPRPESATGAKPELPGAVVALRVRDSDLRRSIVLLLERAGARAVVCRTLQDLRRAVLLDGCSAVLLDGAPAAGKGFVELLAGAESRGIPVGEVSALPPTNQESGTVRRVDRPLTTTRLRQFVRVGEAGVKVGAGNARDEQRMPAWQRPPHVLLVDDNLDSLQVSAAIVRRCGCEVETAAGGLEAVAKAVRQHYDLILMDVEMPDIDGMEATRRLRAAEAAGGQQPVPVVALSAHAFESAKEECLSAGMNGHHSKPATMEGIAALIAKWIPPETTAAQGAGSRDLPAEIAALVPAYLKNRLRDVESIEEAMSRSDFEHVRRIAHNLKGSGAGYGLPQLSALGRELEEQAKGGSRGRICELNRSLAELVRRLMSAKPED